MDDDKYLVTNSKWSWYWTLQTLVAKEGLSWRGTGRIMWEWARPSSTHTVAITCQQVFVFLKLLSRQKCTLKRQCGYRGIHEGDGGCTMWETENTHHLLLECKFYSRPTWEDFSRAINGLKGQNVQATLTYIYIGSKLS